MKKITANTLDSALTEAAKHFNCSITQIEYEVLQNPSNGIFGLWKKEAVIIATKKDGVDSVAIQDGGQTLKSQSSNNVLKNAEAENMQEDTINEAFNEKETIEKRQEQDINSKNAKQNGNENISQTYNNILSNEEEPVEIESGEDFKDDKTNDENNENINGGNINSNNINNLDNANHEITSAQMQGQNSVRNKKSQYNFDSFFYDTDSISYQDSMKQEFRPTKNIESACKEVQGELAELLRFLPLELSRIQVEPYDNHTIFILIDGLDAALLIGQKGYRYKSLSYLLFNWINTCYGYNVRLEIAQFLKNQEDMMRTYLEPIIETAKMQGKAQTKPLDGVLTHIALKMLREALPNKYIVFRENADGEKYISISEFLSRTRSNINGFGNLPKY